ncbi:type I secretion system permease/ATPase [Frigidibacter mobilis]
MAQRRLRPALLAVAGLSAIVNLLMLASPLYMLQVYDRVLTSGSVATLQGLFLLLILLYAFLGVFDFLRSRILGRAAHRLDAALGEPAFGRWLQLPEAGIRAQSGGKDGDFGQAQGLRDVETLRSFLASPALLGLMDLPWIPLYLTVLTLVHPLLGLLTLVGATVAIAAALLNQQLVGRGLDRAGKLEMEERGMIDQSRRHSELIAAHGMQARMVFQWSRLHDARLAMAQGAAERSEGVGAFSKTFRMFLQSAMLTLAAWLVLRAELSPGMIIASSVISGRALAPIDQVIGQWRMLGRARQAHARASKIFGRSAGIDTVDLPSPTGRIRLENVTRLAGAGGGARLLDRVSFELEPGDGLGVIGPSAAGKSVLARVLVGIWRPEAGDIRFDGATPDQWDPEVLGRHIGYLPQHAELLPGSIRDNIARFDPLARDVQVFEAARIAGVHEMILALPQGYATAAIGCPLSGGQVQRLGLARALFGNPPIVVLDEPNANLDHAGDEALRHAILAMRARGSTVIVMAHRPSAILSVNKVLVLKEGRMKQFGPRDEVLGPSAPGQFLQPDALRAAAFEPKRGMQPARTASSPSMDAPAASSGADLSSSSLLRLQAILRAASGDAVDAPCQKGALE